MKNYKDSNDFVKEAILYKKKRKEEKRERLDRILVREHIGYGMRALGIFNDHDLEWEANTKFKEYTSKGYDYIESMKRVMWFVAEVSGIKNNQRIEKAIGDTLTYDPSIKYEIVKSAKKHPFLAFIIVSLLVILLELAVILAVNAFFNIPLITLLVAALLFLVLLNSIVDYFMMETVS